MDTTIKNEERVVCVYCASSQACDPAYHAAAFRLGELLAEGGCTIIYGEQLKVDAPHRDAQ